MTNFYGVGDYKGYYEEKGNDEEQRFVLRTKGDNPLVCIGLYPATACEKFIHDDDMVMELVRAAGNKGIIMLNLYPLRYKYFCAQNEKDGNLIKNNIKSNTNYIRAALSKLREELPKKKITIWAAWGESYKGWRYFKDCLKEIAEVAREFDCEWIIAKTKNPKKNETLGVLTETGHPRSPTRKECGCEWDFYNFTDYIDRYISQGHLRDRSFFKPYKFESLT